MTEQKMSMTPMIRFPSKTLFTAKIRRQIERVMRTISDISLKIYVFFDFLSGAPLIPERIFRATAYMIRSRKSPRTNAVNPLGWFCAIYQTGQTKAKQSPAHAAIQTATIPIVLKIPVKPEKTCLIMIIKRLYYIVKKLSKNKTNIVRWTAV